ncbi:MAG: alpha/beta hydrolase [Cellvibrionaceae bacterium]
MDSTLHLVTVGNPQNPPLVLVHGLGPNGLADWWKIIEALKEDYYILALDLPGFARSSLPNGRLSPENFAAVIRWLVQAHNLENVHLAGHSMGGAVALFYAAHYPEEVQRLTLIDVAGVLHRAAFVKSLVDIDQRNYSFLPDFVQRRAAQILNMGDALVEKINLLPDFTELLRASDIAWDALLSDRPNTNAALSLIGTDYSYLLERVSSPTTIIWGELDTVAPLRTGYLLDHLINDSALHIIPGAGHVPLISHSNRVIALLRKPVPSQPDVPSPSAQDSDADLHCRGQTGASYSGQYRHIVLDDCVNARLVDVQVKSLELRNSTAAIRGLTVVAEGSALRLDNSSIHLTASELRGAVALDMNASRIDMAGVLLQAGKVAIKVDATSVIVASVSESQSPRYTGKLHGLVRTSNSVGEALSQLQSNARPL